MIAICKWGTSPLMPLHIPRLAPELGTTFDRKAVGKGEEMYYKYWQKGITTRILNRNSSSGVNVHGGIFLRKHVTNDTKIHEGLHSIDNNLRGSFNDEVGGMWLMMNNWYEARLRKYGPY